MSRERIFNADDLGCVTAVGITTQVSCCRQHSPQDPEHAPPCALTAAFTRHLEAVRQRSRGPRPRWLQCCQRPVTGTAETALPHLVAVRLHGQIDERTVWEHIDRAVLRRWLPEADDPDRWIEHLDQVHRLRVWLRGNKTIANDARGALQVRLRGHYLSMRFILDHPQLVHDAIHALTIDHTT
jgi:hypothetical protein